MDEIEKRLRDTSDHCFTCYEKWQKDKKNGELREALQEAIHEMRKVTSRLEIEIAVSERDEMTQKPIPIPPHRSSSKRRGKSQDQDDDGDQAGNKSEGSRGGGDRKRRSPSGGGKKAASGGE